MLCVSRLAVRCARLPVLTTLFVSKWINKDGFQQAQEMTGHDAREELCFQQALIRCRLPYNLPHSAGR